jgi:hypothetical protein
MGALNWRESRKVSAQKKWWNATEMRHEYAMKITVEFAIFSFKNSHLYW